MILAYLLSWDGGTCISWGAWTAFEMAKEIASSMQGDKDIDVPENAVTVSIREREDTGTIDSWREIASVKIWDYKPLPELIKCIKTASRLFSDKLTTDGWCMTNHDGLLFDWLQRECLKTSRRMNKGNSKK